MSELVLISQEQPQVPEILKEPPITIEEAEAAAGEAGVSVIRIKKLKASSIIGRFIEQMGAVKIGRTTIITAQENVETGLAQCDALLEKADPETVGFETLIEIIKIRQAYVDLLIKSGLAQMKDEKSASSVANQPDALRVPFPAGSHLAIKRADEPEAP